MTSLTEGLGEIFRGMGSMDALTGLFATISGSVGNIFGLIGS